MKFACSLLFVLTISSPLAVADIVFTILPQNSSIPVGTEGVFDVFISSNSGAVNVAGVDISVQAGDGSGTSGLAKAASATSSLLGVSSAFIDPGLPGAADFGNNLTGGISLSTPQLYATLYLDTTGLALGNHTISFTSLLAINSFFSPVQVAPDTLLTPRSFGFTIAAVPEPTSMMTAATLAFGGMFYRRRRSSRS